MDEIEVLILANVLCMSDEEIERIRNWVARGKGLVATGETSLYDENYRQRTDYGLADLFGVSVSEAAESNREFRNGRVIFTPRTDERVSFNHLNYQLRPKLPDRADTLVGYVTELCEGALPITVDVESEYIAVEMNRVEDAILVHLVNYANEDSALRARISLAEQLAGEVKGSVATVLSPDGGPFETNLDITGEDDKPHGVEIPQLDTYCVVRFPRKG